MERKDYYVILGVARTEDTEGIRRAFRDLALRYHPDRAGPRGTPYFQDIVEAYRVLSDPRLRAGYDRGVEHAGAAEAPPPRPIVPRPQPPAARPEPLVPEPLVPAPLGLMHDFEVTQPSLAEVLERIQRNFTAGRAPKSQRLDALNLELLLDPDEAARGGVVTFGVPVFFPCPACHGTGGQLGYSCSGCGGQGLVEEDQPVRLLIPPMVRDGTVFQLPLQGLGIHNMYLQVLIRVGG